MIFELATCGCHTIIKNDQVAKDASIEFRSRLAKYGTFRCISGRCGPKRDVIGWYRTCVKCSEQYCLRCAFWWNWSNEFKYDKSKTCSCSYCIDRDRLILRYDNSSNGIFVTNVVTDASTAIGPSQNSTNTNNNSNIFNCSVNNGNLVIEPSATKSACIASTFTPPITTIISPRYSCSIHCPCSMK
jgi:hypothetical protein